MNPEYEWNWEARCEGLWWYLDLQRTSDICGCLSWAGWYESLIIDNLAFQYGELNKFI